MDTPLWKLLTDLIKKHGQITYGEMEKYCEENGYRKSNGERRLREVRDPRHRNYDPTIGVIMEGDVIRFYTYKPDRTATQTQNSAPGQEIPPKLIIPTAQPKFSTYMPACCEIYKVSHQFHARGCINAKTVIN